MDASFGEIRLRERAKALKTPPGGFEHLRMMHANRTGPVPQRIVVRFGLGFLIYASLKIFSFFGEAKFGELRPTLPAQVRCRLTFGMWA
jgi:hypothetical protein